MGHIEHDWMIASMKFHSLKNVHRNYPSKICTFGQCLQYLSISIHSVFRLSAQTVFFFNWQWPLQLWCNPFERSTFTGLIVVSQRSEIVIGRNKEHCSMLAYSEPCLIYVHNMNRTKLETPLACCPEGILQQGRKDTSFNWVTCRDRSSDCGTSCGQPLNPSCAVIAWMAWILNREACSLRRNSLINIVPE